MKRTTIATAALALLVLASCGGNDDEADSPSGGTAGATLPAPTETGEATEGGGDAVLTTAESDLGEIVVDAEGMTVYYFDNDEEGVSNCSGECLANWPAVEAEGEGTPVVEGVEAEVGTITRDDGTVQVTLDGLPVYTFAGDSAPGDVTGQAANDVWWVIAPDGTKITTAPSS